MEVHEGIVNANIVKKDNYIKVYSETEIQYYDLSGNEITYNKLYPNNTLYAGLKDGKWGLVDKNGNIVVDYDYDMVTEQNGNVFGIKKDGLWQIVDVNGEMISENKYNISWLDVTFLGKYYKLNNSNLGTVYSETVK